MRYHINLLPTTKIERIDSPEGRKYSTPDGEFYSVTTILSRVLDHSYLDEWKAAIGEEEAERQSKMASSRGTFLHNQLENHLHGLPIEKNMFYGPMVNSVIKEFSKMGEILGIEIPLYSKKLRAAGTADLVAYYDGQLSILDYKTSNKEKYEIDSYFLQTAFYAYMLYERYGLIVKKLVIFLAIEEDFTCKVFTSDAKPYIIRIHDLTRNMMEVIV